MFSICTEPASTQSQLFTLAPVHQSMETNILIWFFYFFGSRKSDDEQPEHFYARNKENTISKSKWTMSERSVSMKITSKKHKAIESKTLRDLIGSLSLYNFFFVHCCSLLCVTGDKLWNSFSRFPTLNLWRSGACHSSSSSENCTREKIREIIEMSNENVLI